MPKPFVIFLLCWSALLTAQSDSLGQWRNLLSYNRGVLVTQSADEVIYSTGNSIFYLDKEDLSIRTLSKTEGLAETRVRLLQYHEPTETLIIVYESGTIDLLRDGRFSTLRQIGNFTFSGDKQIYAVYPAPGERVYLAAGYGVSALNLIDETFEFTTFTGVRVDGVAEYRGDIYAATPEGLYRAPLTETNLTDFGNWDLLSAELGLPGDYSSSAVNTWRDDLYFAVGNDLYRYTGSGEARRVRDEDEDRDFTIAYISGGPTRLAVGYRCTTSRCDDRRVNLHGDEGRYLRAVGGGCAFRTNGAVEDRQGRLWLADGAEDIRYLSDIESNDCQRLTYPGPDSDENFRLFHDGRALWVAPSVLDVNFQPSLDARGVYRFADGFWERLSRNDTEIFRGLDGQSNTFDDLWSIIDVNYDPRTDRYYFSSFYEGLIEYNLADDTGDILDERNTSLRTAIGESDGRVRVAAVATDEAGFLYVANTIAEGEDFISIRSPEGEWAATGATCGVNNVLDMLVDRNGYIWAIHAVGEPNGITVIDPMGTPLDPSDDRCRHITQSNSVLPTNAVRSIEEDLNGVIWVGTAQGITRFDCGIDPFDAERCPGRRPPVRADDGFGGFLLETEDVRDIATDGGNRKWIATTGGVFLLSPNGGDQLRFFDADNSPLLDNLVRSIAIDPTTGTVYFGTELGISSYRAEALTAETSFADDLLVYPNPVRPDYRGPIAVEGLEQDARVKITDVSGKLVFEGTATGGRFLWQGTDYTGRRVTSGVYLVFASTNARTSATNPEGASGKIVFIR